MSKLCKRFLCLMLAVMMGFTVLPCAADARTPSLLGAWETDFVFPASDLGVSAPDVVFRCRLEFQPGGSVRASWIPVELSAIRLYFHQMFVSAYYACAYGAGFTSFEAVEQFCIESTGMGVLEYMFSFLDSYDMYTLFCPPSTSGFYRLNETGNQLYLDLILGDNVSNPNIGNSCSISDNAIVTNLASYGEPSHFLYLSRIGASPEPSVPDETEPPETEPEETGPADETMETVRVDSNTTITIREGQSVHLYCTYDESESYKIYEWEIQSGEDVISIESEYRNCYVTGLEPGTAEIFMRYRYTYEGRDSLTGNPRRIASSKRRVYTIIVE